MNYHHPPLLDELAAHYVVGTLRGRARHRFERLCLQEPAAMQALHRWEDRFVGLMRDVKPVTPPARVWKTIKRRLGHSQSSQHSLIDTLFGWLFRPQLAIAAGVAALALTIAVVTYISLPQEPVVATIVNDQRAEQWRVAAPKDRATLSVSRTAAIGLDPNRDYELWALPDSGAAPVSLGLMPKTGKRELQLSATQRMALAGAGKIAVSLEPIGGSPTGAPTGPVLFVATISRA